MRAQKPAAGERPRVDAWRRPAGRPPYVFGHRGASHAAPENTLAAFQLALDEGADGVELDVRLDRDGDVVVSHDRSLKRVTRGADTRAIAALSRRELDTIDIGAGERMPRLVDVLHWAVERGTRVNIELKADLERRWQLVWAVARLVRRFPRAPESLLFSTFHPGMLAALRRLCPSIPGAWLVHAGQPWLLRETPDALRQLLDARVIHPQHTLVDDVRARRWRQAGLVVNTWTVNAEPEAERLAELGVDTIVTDRPGAIRSHLYG